ncbi:SRPBCC family protein [Polyangium aurulentum]|uniref:SRPBCC family protein n=1 Tax=Polyangium aurulentum TaxID=2567896 RepID=UPI0010AE1DCD|nr:SRPBCC family protein [Polyangium aurulentum]UQA62425.1 SRPBCC family protein [Polyangium aurulentum]
MSLRWLVPWALLLALLFPRAARAGSLTADEKARLDRGEVVTRTFDVDLPGGDYIGGLAYVIIPAPPAEVMSIFLDPQSYGHIFPLTQEARIAGRQGDDWFVYIRQGGRRASGEYTVRVRRETPSLVRFWMDPGRPHDIGDCWGFFRVDPAKDGRTLLTYGALLHLEFGLIKLLFEEKIRGYALQTPALVRSYVEERRAGERPGQR